MAGLPIEAKVALVVGVVSLVACIAGGIYLLVMAVIDGE